MNNQDLSNQKTPNISINQGEGKGTGIGVAERVEIHNYNGLTPESEKTYGNPKDELEALRKKINLYEDFGIVDCTDVLRETALEPLQCMPTIRSHLSFMGVGGEKWVRDAQLRKAFVRMLQRATGEVRFLLINPASESYKKLYNLRNGNVPYESYTHFIDLSKKYENLRVRLYDDMLSFRMQFVNNEYLAVSRYYLDEEPHTHAEGGWKIPHLIIFNEHQVFGETTTKYRNSLFSSFWRSYEFAWTHSIDIQKWDKEGRIFNK